MSILKLDRLLKKQHNATTRNSSFPTQKTETQPTKKSKIIAFTDKYYKVPTIVVSNSFCKLINFSQDQIDMVVKDLTYFDEEANQFKIGVLRSLKGANYAKRTGYTSKYIEAAMKRTGTNFIEEHIEVLKRQLKAAEYKMYKCLVNEDCSFPTGLLRRVSDLLGNPAIEDNKEDGQNHALLRFRNNPPEMRYYQKEIVDKCIESGRGIINSCVGSGKTLMMVYLLKALSRNSLIIVPSSALLTQVGDEMELYFGSAKVSKVTTDCVKSGKKLKPIRLMTIQSLASLTKQKLATKVTGDVDVLILEEFHHSGSESYLNLMPLIENIRFRFGFSGTPTRNDSKILDLWGVLSETLYHYPAYKATEEGYLTPVQYQVYNLPGDHKTNYQKEYTANYCESGILATWVLKLIRNTIPDNEQVLILTDQKQKGGEFLYKCLKQDGVKATYVSGDSKKADTNKAIDDFNKSKIRVLVATQVLGEGIDLKSAQHLVLACGGKSEIKIVQAIGRCVRLFPGKSMSYVYDCNFEGTKFLEKHTQARLDTFKNHFSGEILYK